jgi:hypothetical protein
MHHVMELQNAETGETVDYVVVDQNYSGAQAQQKAFEHFAESGQMEGYRVIRTGMTGKPGEKYVPAPDGSRSIKF